MTERMLLICSVFLLFYGILYESGISCFILTMSMLSLLFAEDYKSTDDRLLICSFFYSLIAEISIPNLKFLKFEFGFTICQLAYGFNVELILFKFDYFSIKLKLSSYFNIKICSFYYFEKIFLIMLTSPQQKLRDLHLFSQRILF